MAATNTGESTSKWLDLPGDVLALISDRLDPEIGNLRLRSVCRSWRSALSPFHPLIHFPLKVPLPLSLVSSSLPSPTILFLRQRTVYLLTPLENPSNESFLIKVEQKDAPNTFSLSNPLCIHPKYNQPNFPINLLDYRISQVVKSYVIYSDSEFRHIPIKKVVVATNFFNNGDFVVLGLKYSGGLLIWRFGDEGWTEIVAPGRFFDDIISYDGKFYATADKKGRLVMIDSRLKPIDLVPKLMYGNGILTHLLECDGNLYLVDRNFDDICSRLGVFKLDDKGRFWDYELNLNDCVFFLGEDANFSLSRDVYNGCIRNVIYFLDCLPDTDEVDEFTKVFQMNKNTSLFLVDSEDFVKLYFPPISWFNDDAAL